MKCSLYQELILQSLQFSIPLQCERVIECHVSTCASCSQFYEEIRRLERQLKALHVKNFFASANDTKRVEIRLSNILSVDTFIVSVKRLFCCSVLWLRFYM